MLLALKLNWKRGSGCMKEGIKNYLVITALTLIILVIVASIFGGKFICVQTIYQILGVNGIIHIGLGMLQKFESKYLIVETFVRVSYTLIVLIGFGFLFKWYVSTPLWVVVLMGVVIYMISSIFDMLKVNHDVMCINEQIKIRKGK